jgi:hypothetical protein
MGCILPGGMVGKKTWHGLLCLSDGEELFLMEQGLKEIIDQNTSVWMLTVVQAMA